MARLCSPLQGFFNFVVFIHPKVVFAKTNDQRRGGSISWCGAFVRVLTCREQQQRLAENNNNNVTLTSRRNRGILSRISPFTTRISSFMSSFRNRYSRGMVKKISSLFPAKIFRSNIESRPATSSPAAESPGANETEVMIESHAVTTSGGIGEDASAQEAIRFAY